MHCGNQVDIGYLADLHGNSYNARLQAGGLGRNRVTSRPQERKAICPHLVSGGGSRLATLQTLQRNRGTGNDRIGGILHHACDVARSSSLCEGGRVRDDEQDGAEAAEEIAKIFPSHNSSQHFVCTPARTHLYTLRRIRQRAEVD